MCRARQTTTNTFKKRESVHNIRDAYKGFLGTHDQFYYCPIFTACFAKRTRNNSNTHASQVYRYCRSTLLSKESSSSIPFPSFLEGNKSKKLRSLYSFLIKRVVTTTSVKRIQPSPLVVPQKTLRSTNNYRENAVLRGFPIICPVKHVSKGSNQFVMQ